TADHHCNILFRIESGLLQEPSRREMLCAAERRSADDLAFELAEGFHFRFSDQPKQVFLQALGNHFGRQITPFHGPYYRADVIDLLSVAAQKRVHADVAAHLNDLW